MSKSPNIGLNLTPNSENTKTFIDFRTELAGDEDDSNMMIIDAEIGKISSDIEIINQTINDLDTDVETIKRDYGEAVTWGTLKGLKGHS